ncbi:HK97 family phage prohead protease [Plesiomonas shigelloides]|uniref:HK97 family phage prohead protease n=1 Tax=Plesiomonas shigelloides TaxID=703 RepID=UPI00387F31D9
MRLQIKSFNEVDAERGVFEAYANVKWVRDRVADCTVDGAFKKSLAEHKMKGTFPKMLWNHDPNVVIGKWLEFEEDEKGLRVKGQLCLEIQAGRETYALMKMGAIDALSIGYITKEERYDPETKTNFLIEVDIREISVVPMPCNEASTISSVKSDSVCCEQETSEMQTEIDSVAEETEKQTQPEISEETMKKLDNYILNLKLDAAIARISGR